MSDQNGNGALQGAAPTDNINSRLEHTASSSAVLEPYTAKELKASSPEPIEWTTRGRPEFYLGRTHRRDALIRVVTGSLFQTRPLVNWWGSLSQFSELTPNPIQARRSGADNELLAPYSRRFLPFYFDPNAVREVRD
jgi:hypothetical protein